MNRAGWVRLGSRAAANRLAETLTPHLSRPVHKPFYVEFEMVRVCNLRCVHCDIWRNARDPRALTAAEWEAQLIALRDWIGPFCLSITSGETFADRSVLRVLKKASGLGIATSCVTNGTFIDDAMAEDIRACGVETVTVSLDGMRPETHDSSRGVPGTHRKATEAIARLHRPGATPRVRVTTIVSGRNLGELADLARWVRDMGLSGIYYQALFPGGDDWRSMWPSDPRAISAALDGLAALKRDGYPILNPIAQLEAMRSYFEDPARTYPELDCRTYRELHIANDGEVRFCRYKRAVGNIRHSTARALWRSSESSRLLGEIRGCKKSCILVNCHYDADLAHQAGRFLRVVCGMA